MYRVSEVCGRMTLTMVAVPMGQDLSICYYGGDLPHIGAVALAEPRASLKNDGSTSASCSVLTVCGHKEDDVARGLASRLAKLLNVRVSVACGIHVDGITEDEMAYVHTTTGYLLNSLLQQIKTEEQG